MATVVALFAKRRSGEPMTRAAELRGIAGHGLDGDLHASAASPRHVLLAGAADIRALGIRDDALRANIILERGLGELASGEVIRIGSLWLRITIPCESCRRLEDEQRGLAKRAGAKRGVLARVIVDGVVREGDEAVRGGHRLPPLSDDWHQRVREIVCAIPAGTVVTYARLAEAAGVQRTYCRALPAVLRALAGAPAHRVVPADLERLTDARRLAEEGVNLSAPTYWSAARFYERDERAFTSERTAPSPRPNPTGASAHPRRPRRPAAS